MLLLQRETEVLVEDCCDRSYCWTFYINKKIWVDQYYLTQSYQCLLYIVMRLNYVMRLLFFGCNRSKRREYKLTEMCHPIWTQSTDSELCTLYFVPTKTSFVWPDKGLNPDINLQMSTPQYNNYIANEL